MQFGSNFGGGGFGGFGGGAGSFGSFDDPQASGVPLQTYNFGTPQADNGKAGRISIEIRKVYLGLTRPQGKQARRSYDVVLDGTGLNVIQNEVERRGVEAFNPNNMGNLMSQGADFLRYSGTPDHSVNIDNGWETERFRFTMVVDVFRNGKFTRTEFISGSTDHAGVTNMGLISSVAVDPNMVFTINHVSEARMRQMDAGGRPVALISRANGVVRNDQFGGLGVGGNNLYMTRPSDVLRAVDKVSLYQGMQQAESFGVPGSMSYQDLDSMLTGQPLMAADQNLLIPTFASRTLKGLYQNSLQTFDPMNMDGQGGGAMASELVKDTPINSSGLVHVMNMQLANGVTHTGQFTWADLIRLDPTIDDRADIFGRSYESGSIVIPDGREVANLADAEAIALHATSIAHTTLALMSMAGVATLAYNATNELSGQTQVTLQACDGMDHDGMLGNRLEALKGRLALECLNIISVNGEITYSVDVFADAFNDVYIQLTWDGMRRDYVVPAFASSSLAPVVTHDLNRLVGMAEAINEVVTTCKRVISPNAHEGFGGETAIFGNGEERSGGLAGDY